MGQKKKGCFGSLFGQETGNCPLLLSIQHHKGPVHVYSCGQNNNNSSKTTIFELECFVNSFLITNFDLEVLLIVVIFVCALDNLTFKISSFPLN